MPHNPYDGPTKGSGIDRYHTTLFDTFMCWKCRALISETVSMFATFTCWKCGAMISETVTVFVDDYGRATTESQCPSCDFVGEYEFKLGVTDE